jgi:hypothetical protein
MADNRNFGMPVDTRGKAAVGGPHPYGNQFEHDENEGYDEPIGRDPNDNGSPVFPDWWRAGQAQDD